MHIASRHTASRGTTGLVAEASTLGLRPGEWPDFIALVDDPAAPATTGALFLAGERLVRDGELLSVTYRTASGLPLTVWND